MTTSLFISSVQKELADERRAVKAFIEGDPLLRRFFTVFLFEQVDMALDFVLSKLNLSVGTRAESVQAPVRYEIPPVVLREAIVNAIAHRDYTSSGAVQISVFADRVEVWNPGTLLSPLTPETLRQPHRSLLRNPRLSEVLFLARYIEKYGTGILMMIRESLAHGLPEPDFAQRGGEFTTAVWRDWLTENVLAGLQLNERQKAAVTFVQTHQRIDNATLRQLTGAIYRTASRDLDDLVRKGVLALVGKTGRGAHYVLARKRDTNRTNRTPRNRLQLGQPRKSQARPQKRLAAKEKQH